MEKLDEEFSDANKKAQEYLNPAEKTIEIIEFNDWGVGNTRQRRIEESIARKSVEIFRQQETRRWQKLIGQKDELKQMPTSFKKDYPKKSNGCFMKKKIGISAK